MQDLKRKKPIQFLLKNLYDLEHGKDEKNGTKESVPVLYASGSQRTYISKDITDKLKLNPIDKNFLTIYTFDFSEMY